MMEKDLPDVMRIQEESYSRNLVEKEDVYREKLRSHPSGCLVVERGPCVVAYAISHPWSSDGPPRLDAVEELPSRPTVFHIHDISVARSSRGKNLGGMLVQRIREIARDSGFDAISLVCVQNRSFWEKLGFKETSPEKSMSVANYPPGCICMTGHSATRK